MGGYLLMNHQTPARGNLERVIDGWLHAGKPFNDRADFAPFLAFVLGNEQVLLH
jgi:hypothetical protein